MWILARVKTALHENACDCRPRACANTCVRTTTYTRQPVRTPPREAVAPRFASGAATSCLPSCRAPHAACVAAMLSRRALGSLVLLNKRLRCSNLRRCITVHVLGSCPVRLSHVQLSARVHAYPRLYKQTPGHEYPRHTDDSLSYHCQWNTTRDLERTYCDSPMEDYFLSGRIHN